MLLRPALGLLPALFALVHVAGPLWSVRAGATPTTRAPNKRAEEVLITLVPQFQSAGIALWLAAVLGVRVLAAQGHGLLCVKNVYFFPFLRPFSKLGWQRGLSFQWPEEQGFPLLAAALSDLSRRLDAVTAIPRTQDQAREKGWQYCSCCGDVGAAQESNTSDDLLQQTPDLGSLVGFHQTKARDRRP